MRLPELQPSFVVLSPYNRLVHSCFCCGISVYCHGFWYILDRLRLGMFLVVAKETCYILIIENADDNFLTMRQELSKRNINVRCFHVDSEYSMQEALDIRKWDLFLAQCNTPDFCQSPIFKLWKSRCPEAPLIVVTDKIHRDRALRLLDCGVSDVVAKKDLHSLLPAMERWLSNFAVQEEFREKIKLFDDTLLLMKEACFHFQTLAEARKLADQLALICPEPEKRVFGLRELFVNAVEHGNLGITYADKTELNELEIWDKEVERRLSLPENRSKFVEVQLKQTPEEIRFFIKDQGEGFDWKSYMEGNPFGSYVSHGFGIAMAKGGSFDHMEYRGCGNEVLVIVKHKQAPQHLNNPKEVF
jgi:anti-sigma regulatory factor (Ser/Thr protein kinase)